MYLFESLNQLIQIYLPEDQIKRLQQAYLVARDAHEGQTRSSGEPYITHPVAVACILAEMKLDYETLMAALLHDVAEDSGYTLEDLAAMGFDEAVINALRLLTHDKRVPYLEYVARLRTDPIARAVKLADLRHNSDLSRLNAVDEKALRRVEKYAEAIRLLTGE